MTIARIAVVISMTFYLTAFRVEAQDGKSGNTDKPDHEHQTYLKGGLVHTGSEVENFNIVVNGLSIDLETYFNKNHVGLSGWSVGYRKDNFKFTHFGHVFNLGAFRTINTPAAEVKVGWGVEWGVTSPNFNKTRFNYEGGRLVSYEQLFLQKNTNIPGLGPAHDSALYPFVEAGLLKRWNWFLVEAGVRGNVQKFGFDQYHLDGDNVEFNSSSRTRIVSSLFIKLGVAIGGDSTKIKE